MMINTCLGGAAPKPPGYLNKYDGIKPATRAVFHDMDDGPSHLAVIGVPACTAPLIVAVNDEESLAIILAKISWGSRPKGDGGKAPRTTP